MRVLDTCTGDGHIWTALRQHVTVEQWTRCDRRPRGSNILKMEASEAVRAFPLSAFNVIDIDPYGEPWSAYSELLQRFAALQDATPLAVFLTHGHIDRFKHLSYSTLNAVGIPAMWVSHLPRTPTLTSFIAGRLLSTTWQYAIVQCAARAEPSGQVSYYALGLAPLKEAHG